MTSPFTSSIGKRITMELESANQVLHSLAPAVTIFGGTRVKPDDACYLSTIELARTISAAGIPVISGGGPGIMEAANKGARAGMHGASVGLNILLPFETPNQHHDLSLMFEHFASRKITFCRHSRAFVCMPGGVGTLDELFECLTLIQTGKMPEVPVLLFGRAFWSGLLEWLENTVLARGLISNDDLKRRIQLVDSVEEAMAIIVR
ncbi:TIGR00730 family Rossman fold protein [Rhodoferax lacus]|uniref:Cytokinin riboside 5'-monophosphate phosphoribohydrolase n=1 Tax=Rhodoferax lacus TaxID=2184758 RepID=A0A3E1RFF8_9BURK|nr:TIGR00730 family Rossman fold protein [Rhodoferax lacus]RFO98094.1 TIGR00730 family Rossman fold protein [Rhodoferax lacus]